MSHMRQQGCQWCGSGDIMCFHSEHTGRVVPKEKRFCYLHLKKMALIAENGLNGSGKTSKEALGSDGWWRGPGRQ